ncbi:MAG: hypothetical protein WB729_20130 [Candidatus Sulfotelmatobacter sp.]
MVYSSVVRAFFILILVLALALLACTSQPKTPAPDPATILQSLPVADPGKYEHVEMRSWRNPYLILHADGVALLDPADNAEIQLKPNEMLPALAALPASAWPYGRVVAIAESRKTGSEQESVSIRRNKGIVGGILESAHVAINWVPSK